MTSRREFLRASAALATACWAGGCGEQGEEELGPISAEVTARTAVLWARTRAETLVCFEYATDSGFAESSRTDAVRVTDDTDFTWTADLSGLTPGTRYYYRAISSSGCPLPLHPVGELRTAPEGAASCLFAWSADLLLDFRPFEILDAMAAASPDVFLMLGDSAYADHPEGDRATDLAAFRRKHREIRRSPELLRLMAKVATYGTWDDHECENDADRTHPLMPPARRAFREYWPVRAAEGAGDGLYRSFSWGSLVDAFILDCRTFRDPKSHPNGPGKTMLGPWQKEWLKDSLRASRAPFKLLVSSVPLLSPFGDDCWFGYAAERDEIKAFIRSEVRGRLIVLSADFHMAWHMEDAGSGLHELIAGPVGAWPFEQMFPERVSAVRSSGRFHIIDGSSYGLVHVDEGGGAPSLSASIHDAAGAERYRAAWR